MSLEDRAEGTPPARIHPEDSEKDLRARLRKFQVKRISDFQEELDKLLKKYNLSLEAHATIGDDQVLRTTIKIVPNDSL